MITHVAIQYHGKIYSLPRPNRHHDVIRAIAAENGVGIDGPDVQGFLDQGGTFYNRRQAYMHVIASRQLKRSLTAQYTGNLYSEDLW